MAIERRRSHYHFLDDHFNTILTRMGCTDYVNRFGNFSASGDKYSQYQTQWEDAGVPYFHGAAMYHLMELLYSHEVRETKHGWIHPYQWVIDNYRGGYNLSQHMEGLE
jgi:hypothetical protein